LIKNSQQSTNRIIPAGIGFPVHDSIFTLFIILLQIFLSRLVIKNFSFEGNACSSYIVLNAYAV